MCLREYALHISISSCLSKPSGHSDIKSRCSCLLRGLGNLCWLCHPSSALHPRSPQFLSQSFIFKFSPFAECLQISNSVGGLFRHFYRLICSKIRSIQRSLPPTTFPSHIVATPCPQTGKFLTCVCRAY